MAFAEEQLGYMIVTHILGNISLIAVNHKTMHKAHHRMLSNNLAYQFHQRKTKNCLNSLRRNLEEEESHHRSNFWIMIEKF